MQLHSSNEPARRLQDMFGLGIDWIQGKFHSEPASKTSPIFGLVSFIDASVERILDI